jgi:hypothetical protein
MIVQREGEEQPEKRDIFEVFIYTQNRSDMHFVVGVGGVKALGMSAGTVNVFLDNDDMHAIFVSSADTVYIKHRKSAEQLIVVPDIMAPSAP